MPSLLCFFPPIPLLSPHLRAREHKPMMKNGRLQHMNRSTHPVCHDMCCVCHSTQLRLGVNLIPSDQSVLVGVQVVWRVLCMRTLVDSGHEFQSLLTGVFTLARWFQSRDGYVNSLRSRQRLLLMNRIKNSHYSTHSCHVIIES